MDAWLIALIILAVFIFFGAIIAVLAFTRKSQNEIVVWNASTGADGVLVEQRNSMKNPEWVDLVIRPTGALKTVTWKDIPRKGIKDYFNLPERPEGIKIVLFDGSDRESIIYQDLMEMIKNYRDTNERNQIALAAKRHEEKLMVQQPMGQITNFAKLRESIDDKTKRDARNFPEGYRRP